MPAAFRWSTLENRAGNEVSPVSMILPIVSNCILTKGKGLSPWCCRINGFDHDHGQRSPAINRVQETTVQTSVQLYHAISYDIIQSDPMMLGRHFQSISMECHPEVFANQTAKFALAGFAAMFAAIVALTGLSPAWILNSHTSHEQPTLHGLAQSLYPSST